MPMYQVFHELVEKLDMTTALYGGALIMTRLMIIVYMVPFLGGSAIPNEVKIGLGLLLTVIAYPAAVSGLAEPISTHVFVIIPLMFKEMFVGLVIGFICAEVFYGVSMAGKMLDQARQMTMSQMHIPEDRQQSTETGLIAHQLMLMAILISGGHRIFLMGVFESFRSIPITSYLNADLGIWPLAETIIKQSGDLWVVALALVSPGIFACFLTDLVFGLLNRVAPQINAYFMSMALKGTVGMVMFLLAIHMFADRLEYLAADMFRILKLSIEMMSL